MGKDADARAEHAASHSSQSRLVSGARSVEPGWAEGAAGFARGSLHPSTARRIAEFVQPTTATRTGTGRTSGTTKPATTAGAPAADASGRGSGNRLSHRSVFGR